MKKESRMFNVLDDMRDNSQVKCSVFEWHRVAVE